MCNKRAAASRLLVRRSGGLIEAQGSDEVAALVVHRTAAPSSILFIVAALELITIKSCYDSAGSMLCTDVAANGLINSSDISTVKSKSGTAIP
jgi:hypothetical protein